MKLKKILSLEVLFLILTVGQTYGQQTPTPATAPHSIPTLAVPTIVFPRTDVKPADDEIQPPTDSTAANDNLGFYGSPSAASPAGTPNSQTTTNNETIQKTVTALLANPGFNMQDDLSLSPTPTSAAGQTIPINTPKVLSPVMSNSTPTTVNTLAPSLKDISSSPK
jgi:hypothetical protein